MVTTITREAMSEDIAVALVELGFQRSDAEGLTSIVMDAVDVAHNSAMLTLELNLSSVHERHEVAAMHLALQVLMARLNGTFTDIDNDIKATGATSYPIGDILGDNQNG